MDDLADCVSLEESPNLERKPFFLGFTSSPRPTSSKVSSSMMSGLVKLVEWVADRVNREHRESREVREGPDSGCMTGERADIS